MSSAFEWREAPIAQFAVVGDPVSHSWSPRMQRAALESLGRAEEYVAIRVPLDEFDQALERLKLLGYIGLNATVPLKESAFGWSRLPDAVARRLRAANTLRLGDGSATNTDVGGLLDVVQDLGVQPPGPVLLLGAGGTARAAAFGLTEAGFTIRLHNRTRSRAESLASDLGIEADIVDDPDPAGCSLILNATAASLQNERLPIDWARAEKDAIALDAMYSRSGTPFLEEAARAGLKAVDGRELLVAQGARSLEWWLGVAAPRQAMREALP